MRMAGTEIPNSAPETTYSLNLDGNGVTVRRDVPESTARKIIALVMGGAALQPASHGLAPPAGDAAPDWEPGARLGQTSIRNFLDEAGPKRNADKITAIAAYLKDLGQGTFTRDQVKKHFRMAREPIPGNYGRDFADALATGWIAEDHTYPGSYYITSSGEAALRDGFPGKIRRRGRRKARKANKAGDEA